MHLKMWPWSVSHFFSVSISWILWNYQSIHYMVFCSQKIPNKDISWYKSEIIYTRLYLNKLESIMRALSDALPTGRRAMANPTLQLHFGCGRATPPVSHSHNWPSGRMQIFLFKIGQKSYFLPIKTPKLILTIERYYRSMYCRSNAIIFLKWPIWRRYHLLPP